MTAEQSGRRIAIVSPNYFPQTCGVGDHSARVAVELARLGHVVAIFTRAPAESNPETPDVPVEGVSGASPVVIAGKIGRALRAFRPTDVVIQYTAQMWDAWRFGSPAVPALAFAARRLGARVILVAHELYVPWRQRPDLAVATLLQRLQFGALLSGVDRFFVTTDSRADAVRPVTDLLRLPSPEVVRVGPNAIPVPAIPRTADGRASTLRLGVFSTAAAGKRFDVVLDAFAELSAELPSTELVLIGDLGPPDAPRVRAIREAIERHPARPRIRLTGKVSLRQVADEIAALSIFLFPMEAGATTRSGTLPVALGAGVPVVAVVGVDTDPIFRDGENILFASEMSGPAFAAVARRLIREPELRTRVGQGGRQLHDDHLSWARIARQLVEPPAAQRERNGFSTT